MCTRQRQIRNRYTGQLMFVKCGHCKSCQQEKAVKRSRRIRAEYSPNVVVLSCTLTYDRWAVPYVKMFDLLAETRDLPVYRRCEDRYVRANGRYDITLHRDKGEREIDKYYVDYDYGSLRGLKQLNKGAGNVGVIYYKDVQDFNKRLKQTLWRQYGIDQYVYFVASEYGGDGLRPHHHLLIFCPLSSVELFRSAVRKNWTYGDMSKERRIEVARDMAGYVASYVNRGSDFPKFLATNFPPKTHFSQGFGTRLSVFQLDSILAKVRRGDLSYNIASKKSPDGFTTVLVPKYVINKYFPQFKGASRLSCDALHDVLRSSDVTAIFKYPDECSRIDYSCKQTIVKRSDGSYCPALLDGDFTKINTRLKHASEYFRRVTGLSQEDFCYWYERVWTCYRSNCLKYLHTSPDAPPLAERYDNLYEVDPDSVDFDFIEVNPNNFSSVIRQTKQMVDVFDSYCKYKRDNNAIVRQIDDEF